MVLSPFHLLKARITVEANVSVSFITVIIQLSHTASTLPSHHDDVTGRKLQKLPSGDKSVGSVADFDILGLGFTDRPHDGQHGGPSRVVRQSGIHHSFPVIRLFQGLRFCGFSDCLGLTPSWTVSTLSFWSLCLVAVETAGWGPGAPGLAEAAPQFERHGAGSLEAHGAVQLVVVPLSRRWPEGVGDLSRPAPGADVRGPFVGPSGVFIPGRTR